MRSTILLPLLLVGPVAVADEAETFFDDGAVREVRITFEMPDWYARLRASHATDPNDPYFPARFECLGIALDPVGVRFKGNSSFNMMPTVKKSLKVDFNAFAGPRETSTFLGLEKLNLNNGFKDPTLLREKLFLDFAGRFVPAIRAVHARVFINDAYWGLYTAVEQVDKTFVRSRFGGGEDGNLFKAQASDAGGGPPRGGDLSWLGDDPAPYRSLYQLKTNEDEGDYSPLIELADILNHVGPDELPGRIEAVFDVRNVLKCLALNALFVNLDSYCGSAQNYYLYDRDDTGRFVHLHWDTNETFARFPLGVAPGEDLLRLPPLWISSVPLWGQRFQYPLMSRLWQVDAYREYYVGTLSLMLREGFDEETFARRIHELADRIRPAVYADLNKQYTNEQFERNLTDSIPEVGPAPPGGETIYGLETFVRVRVAYLAGEIDPLPRAPELQITEVAAVNDSTLSDGEGDFDDWVEIHNPGREAVNAAGCYVADSDDLLWRIPEGHAAATTVPAGGYVLIWFDGEPEQGPLHVDVKLSGDGDAVYLYAPDGIQLVGGLRFGKQYADVTLIPDPGGSDAWILTAEPTPGRPNTRVEPVFGCTNPLATNYDPAAHADDGTCALPSSNIRIFINEVLASNGTINTDDFGEADDWIELYYDLEAPVSLGGFTLTDDVSDIAKWSFPEATISGEGFLLLWADRDEDQGPYHVGFRLSASAGEEIGLFDAEGRVVDFVSLGPQEQDVSFGRLDDGGPAWGFFDEPTPGASNSARIHLWIGDVDCDGRVSIGDAICLLTHLLGGPAAPCATPCCTANEDTNGDGWIALDDAIVLLIHLFREGEVVSPNGMRIARNAIRCAAYLQAEVHLPCATPCLP